MQDEQPIKTPKTDSEKSVTPHKSKLDEILYRIAVLRENSVGSEQWDNIEVTLNTVHAVCVDSKKLLEANLDQPGTGRLLDDIKFELACVKNAMTRLGSLPSENASEHKTLVTVEKLKAEIDRLYANVLGALNKHTVTVQTNFPQRHLDEIRETLGRDVHIWIRDAVSRAVSETVSKKVQVEIGEKIQEHKTKVKKTTDGPGWAFMVICTLMGLGTSLYLNYTTLDPVTGASWISTGEFAGQPKQALSWVLSTIVGLAAPAVMAGLLWPFLRLLVSSLYRQVTRPFRAFWNLLSNSIKPNDSSYHYDHPSVWGVASIAGLIGTVVLLIADSINLPDLIDLVVHGTGRLSASWTSTDIVQTFWYVVPHLIAGFGWLVTYLIYKKRPKLDPKIEAGKTPEKTV